MGKAYDYLAAGFIEERKFDCAERMLRSINAGYELHLSDESLKLAAAFGGGMGMQYTCGAISGALMGLASMFVKERAHEDDKIRELARELFKAVEAKLGCSDCLTLVEKHRTESGKCNKIIYTVAEAVDEIIEREMEKSE